MPRRLSSSSRILLAATLGLLLLGLGSLLWSWVGPEDARLVHEIPPAPDVGGPFELTDQSGRRRSDADFRGRYMLVAFGYSHCPDVCPLTLRTMSLAIDALGETNAAAAARVVPIFITVDPARDSVAVLADYAARFHPRLVALTGSRDEIAAVADSYLVYHAQVAPAAETADEAGTEHANHDAAGDYLVEHSSSIYLMGPQGDYLTRFPYDIGPAELAAAIADRMAL